MDNFLLKIYEIILKDWDKRTFEKKLTTIYKCTREENFKCLGCFKISLSTMRPVKIGLWVFILI